MNDKELFYLFLKYSNVVISRYGKLTSKKEQNLYPTQNRKNFEEELQISKNIINSGYTKEGYNCDFPNYL